ncbi:MAG: VOC family protein [Betaproteobacteria bacterium]|nr:VOC family protein [Betaproteobacteria bacterium]
MTTGSQPLATLAARLDHAGVIVRDLEITAQAWESMGFQLTPPSRQRGRMPDRDEPGPWATANRCAVFREGYLELIGVVDASCFNPWGPFLDRFEGMHILALRVDSADDAWKGLGRIPALADRFAPPCSARESSTWTARRARCGFATSSAATTAAPKDASS